MASTPHDWTHGAPKWAAVLLLSLLTFALGVGLAVRPGSPRPPVIARLDLNAATLPQLELLPGVGPARARAIAEARARTPFATTDDMARVPGFDRELINRIRPLVRASGSP